MRRLNWEENFVMVTPDHPEVTPRNWVTDLDIVTEPRTLPRV